MNWAVFLNVIGGFGGFIAVLTFAISASERAHKTRNWSLIALIICILCLATGIGLLA